MNNCTDKFKLAGKEERPSNIVYFFLRDHFKGKILDVGCGQGRHLKLMPKGSIGIDLYQNKELNQEYNLLIHDLNRGLPFKDECLDLVFASHILEHLDSPYLALKDFNRCLKLGGKLILGIPNPDCVYFDYYGLSAESDWSEHIYAWDLKQGFRFITNCNFQVEKVYCNFPFSEKFGKLWNSLPLTKRFSGDLWFIAIKKGSKIYLKTPRRNMLEKIFRKIFGSAMSQPPEEK